MAGEIFRSVIANTLQETLDGIIDDPTDGVMSKRVHPKWLYQDEGEGAFQDFLEMSGPGLAAVKPEGADATVGTLREGVMSRVVFSMFAQSMLITHEAMKDTKYPQAIRIAQRLKRSMAKTEDYDASLMLVRGWNTAYTNNGTGQPLFSASQPLAGGAGGTYSNTMAQPMSPSRAAVKIAATTVAKMLGHDGTIEGYELKKVVCPSEQRWTWVEITKSQKAPEAGEFNAINVVNSEMDLEVVPVPYWNSTTTNYAFVTNVGTEGDGACFVTREEAQASTWVHNSGLAMSHLIFKRWGRFWKDPRGMYGVQA